MHHQGAARGVYAAHAGADTRIRRDHSVAKDGYGRALMLWQCHRLAGHGAEESVAALAMLPSACGCISSSPKPPTGTCSSPVRTGHRPSLQISGRRCASTDLSTMSYPLHSALPRSSPPRELAGERRKGCRCRSGSEEAATMPSRTAAGSPVGWVRGRCVFAEAKTEHSPGSYTSTLPHR